MGRLDVRGLVRKLLGRLLAWRRRCVVCGVATSDAIRCGLCGVFFCDPHQWEVCPVCHARRAARFEARRG